MLKGFKKQDSFILAFCFAISVKAISEENKQLSLETISSGWQKIGSYLPAEDVLNLRLVSIGINKQIKIFFKDVAPKSIDGNHNFHRKSRMLNGQLGCPISLSIENQYSGEKLRPFAIHRRSLTINNLLKRSELVPDMKELDLKNFPISTENFSQLLHKFPAMKKLSISSSDEDQNMPPLLEHRAPYLKDVQHKRDEENKNEGYGEKSLNSIMSLDELNISGNGNKLLSLLEEAYATQKSFKLKVLDMSHIQWIEPLNALFFQLVKGNRFPYLEELILINSFSTSDQIDRFVQHALPSSLIKVNFVDNNISGKQLVTFVSNNGKIDKISFSHPSKWSVEDKKAVDSLQHEKGIVFEIKKRL